MKYKFVGLNPDELAIGRPLAPGDVVDLSKSDAEKNSRLIEEGLLLAFPSEPKQTKKSKAQERDK